MRPVTAAGNELVQVAHHLATIAHAERKRIITCEKCGKVVAGSSVEQDRFRPALTGTQHIAVGKTAAGDKATKVRQCASPGENVAHVHVVGYETGAIEGCGHFDLTVDALLPQNGD